MIRVELELSSTDTPATSVFTVANWVAATLQEEMAMGVTIHSIHVEEV